MPQFNTTIEDYSPVINYSQFGTDWRAGTSADSSADLYSDSSFTVTQADGAQASFTFNGTSFTIFGSKRENHGFIQVQINGISYPPTSTQASDPGQFQVPLFSSPSLVQGLHTVTLTNQGTTFADIDFITWQSSIGAEDEQLLVNTVQDSDESFVYTPANSWGTNLPSTIGHILGAPASAATASPGAFMTYTFQVSQNDLLPITRCPGDGVSLYGPVGPDGSPFTASVDGGVVFNSTANKQFYRPQVLLYSATNLGPGEHVVKMEYQPAQTGQIFAIDYANVYTTPSLKPASGLPNGAVAGIILALLFILFILAGLLFFLRRRKSRNSISAVESQTVQWSAAGNRGIVIAPAKYTSAQYPSAYPSSDAGSYYRSGPALAVETQSEYVPSAPSASSESEYPSSTSHYVRIVLLLSSLVNLSTARVLRKMVCRREIRCR
ncbi:hypothetical protein B0H17DRAFT_1042349 [Mycena rosella]|uniref:Transmembrane protein n=1 Tax=Mycena rosella TaxID=1033263 RepID=A0AAD7DZZ7_MYCRO|nr:hypothetical protein B0H17DRAFT_1042349 [Mycena rosella]